MLPEIAAPHTESNGSRGTRAYHLRLDASLSIPGLHQYDSSLRGEFAGYA